MAPMQKKIGPLSISNIRLQYKNGHLLILPAAAFQMGPLAFNLLGFGLDLDFTRPVQALSICHRYYPKSAASAPATHSRR